MTQNRHHLSDEAVRALTLPTDPWLSCEECFELSDEFAELVLAYPATTSMTAMFVHLRACPACAEEAQSLVTLLAQTQGQDPASALARLRS